MIAHNQFRFNFSLFLKGLRPTVWETTDINIGGKNPTSINFEIIQNRVRFIVKYNKILQIKIYIHSKVYTQ